MHGANYEFLNELKPKYPEYFSNCKVLEIGSRNIQGKGRLPFKSYFDNCEYIGIDSAAGNGVDMVVRAQDTLFPQKYFDTILCFSVFEHDPDWKITLSHNIPFVKDGGMLFLAWGADGNLPHKPYPFKEVTEQEFLDFVKTLPVEVIESFFESPRYKKPAPGGYVAILKVKADVRMKNNFSFFYAKGGAGIIRGVQMAEYFGAKQNPTEGFEDDICIYVKVRPPDNHPKHAYLDIVDATDKIGYVGEHPEVKVIVESEIARKFLEERTGRKDIIFIPEHHCNYERAQRPDKPIATVGIIGGQDTFQLPLPEFESALKKMGLNLLYYEGFWKHFKTGRLAVVDFYNKIDIQVVYRENWYIKSRFFANPLKLENAGSFGIPTVAYPEDNYKAEWKDHFIEATSMWEMLKHVRRLKEDPIFYKEWQERSLEYAEKYHIDHIAKFYRQLT